MLVVLHADSASSSFFLFLFLSLRLLLGDGAGGADAHGGVKKKVVSGSDRWMLTSRITVPAVLERDWYSTRGWSGDTPGRPTGSPLRINEAE